MSAQVDIVNLTMASDASFSNELVFIKVWTVQQNHLDGLQQTSPLRLIFLRQRKSAAGISAAIGFKKTCVHRIVGELQSYPMLNFHSEMESVSIQQAAIHLVF